MRDRIDLYQCPYDPAYLCVMDEPCPGCKSFRPERLNAEKRQLQTAYETASAMLKQFEAENELLKAELTEERELPTIAYMNGQMSRDDEVRELRAMCDDLVTFLESALGQMSVHNPCCKLTPWNKGAWDILKKYEAMTTNKSKDG